MLSVDATAVQVTYDAFGRAVEQNRGGSYTQIVYAPSGAKLALMNGTTLVKGFVPLPGGPTAVYAAGTTGPLFYRHADWLGSSRLASTQSRTKYFDVSYAPFGENYNGSGTTDYSFAGQNQDTVTGYDDFLFREYSPVQGRWLSPDPAGMAAVDPTVPQSWNRYSYVMNNPLALVDPLGLCVIDGKEYNSNDWVCNPGQVGSSGPGGPGGSGIPIYGLYWNGERYAQYISGFFSWFYGGESRVGGIGGGDGAANNSIKQKICSAIPSGRTVGVSGGVGGVGSVVGGGELVINYDSGQVSAFGFGGAQVGWNGGLSAAVYSGFVWGLNSSNSNYSGGFTGVNGGAGLAPH
jgi:RHS repeat-associated protein